MAKVQKTIMVPEDLHRLAAEFEKTTGANFTRVVIAALIKYLLGDLDQPHPHWMRLTVALERGDLTLPRLVASLARDKLREFKEEYMIDNDTTEVVVEEGIEAVKRGERRFTGPEFEYDSMTRTLEHWINLGEAKEDPLGKVIAALNKREYIGVGTFRRTSDE